MGWASVILITLTHRLLPPSSEKSTICFDTLGWLYAASSALSSEKSETCKQLELESVMVGKEKQFEMFNV